MSRLPLLFQSIVLVTLAGCAGDTIDRSRFRADVCAPVTESLQGLEPATPIAGATLFGNAQFGTGPRTIKTFGVLCGDATDKPTCLARVEAAHKGDIGWFPQYGDVPDRRYLVTSAGDSVSVLTTREQVVALLGAIDTLTEANLLVTEFSPHRVQCGGNANSLQDGSFELLTQTGSGCGDDIELHVVRVNRNGTFAVTETETLKEGNPNCAIGRRTEGVAEACIEGKDLGAFFARMAHLEACAVPAFKRLARELRAHGAPRRLIAGALRAARDEVRHALAIAKLARRFGGEPEPVIYDELELRDLESIARENAAEGCVREAFGALVATYQSHAARDPQIQKIMRGIARDETRHAQLSWDVARWAIGKLDSAARVRIDAAVAEAVASLRNDMATPACNDAIELAGFPTRERAMELFEQIAPRLWAA